MHAVIERRGIEDFNCLVDLKYSWGAFPGIVGIFKIVYYAFIILRFYRQDAKHFFRKEKIGMPITLHLLGINRVYPVLSSLAPLPAAIASSLPGCFTPLLLLLKCILQPGRPSAAL